ncbi:hypothetical protein EBT25_15710 [bacterium]|nr:hypothetical protein [bacterium]
MKKLLMILMIGMLTGCSALQSIKEKWPRAHDPVMFDHLIRIEFDIGEVNCENPDWKAASKEAALLAKYTEWRGDPQRTNIKGLHDHVVKMSKGGSKTFCELGKKTALGRIDAARQAWEGR